MAQKIFQTFAIKTTNTDCFQVSQLFDKRVFEFLKTHPGLKEVNRSQPSMSTRKLNEKVTEIIVTVTSTFE